MTPTQFTVIEYVTEEVQRQGHDTTVLDGIERVGWMLDGWSYALEQTQLASTGSRPHYPVLVDIVRLAKKIERHKNANGIRKCGVRVGMRICPPASEIGALLSRLLAHGESLKPLEYYREFLEIHPFVDGNGRTGKVLLNWLSCTLLNPIFPPADFWGHEIRNP